MPKSVRSWLTAKEAGLIRASFIKATAKPGEISTLFYQRLFTLDPSVRGLFHGDMREQGRKLISTLTFIVESLDQPERLLPTVRELGVRHANYGVKEHHYATVGEALVWGLERAVGRTFTKETRVAWKRIYAGLADAMIDAAKNC